MEVVRLHGSPGNKVDFDCVPLGLPILGPVTDEIAVPMTVRGSGVQSVTASPPSAEQVAEQRIRQRASAAFAAGCKAVGIKMFCCGDHAGAALVAAVPQGKLLQDEPAALAWLTKQLGREATGDDYMAFMDAVYEAWNAGANAAPAMPHKLTLMERLHGAKEIMLTRLGVGTASDGTAEARLRICETCTHNRDGTCELCGCDLSEKVYRAKEACPHSPPFWPAE